ncbi:hypothetical protein [Haloferax sp. DFSO52]|uniref:hypothetical protein n=1 Tax=Haloferax sp. DFSO52 TaxID=3388505 RepID=UPI003A84B6B8
MSDDSTPTRPMKHRHSTTTNEQHTVLTKGEQHTATPTNQHSTLELSVDTPRLPEVFA